MGEEGSEGKRAPMRVLVVDDEPAQRAVLGMRIEQWGHVHATAGDLAEAEAVARTFVPDLIVSDVVMPGGDGIELLRRLRGEGTRAPVILITAHANVDSAVEAMKHGALDFLTKPLDYTKLHALIETAAAERAERSAARDLDARLSGSERGRMLLGDSAGIRELSELVQVVATSDASVLVTGESGTGKEVVARSIHALSGRARGPFVAVNAAAIPEGLIESEVFGHERGAFTGAVQARAGCFEQADGGTLFLDEIAEMPMALQPKLLRVLEAGSLRRLGGSRDISFDVRVLAATNRPAAEAVREGHLREDLYYRLNVFELVVPPLRTRGEDVPLLAHAFIREFNRKHDARVEGLRGSACALLEGYAWPGNVRELRNVVERAVILARQGWIEPLHLPPYLREQDAASAGSLVLPAGLPAAEVEKRLILRTLEEVGGNKAEAARRLQLDVKTIRNKLKGYGEVSG